MHPGHRVAGNQRNSVEGAGWEFAHVAIEDYSRVAFVQMHPDEKKLSAVEFLKAAVARYQALGVAIKRPITDNGSAYRSQLFARTCQALVHLAHVYQALSSANQLQGRALHPDLPARGAYAGTWHTAPSAPLACLRSWPTTTPAGPTQPWATSRQRPALPRTTYCKSTLLHPP